MSRKQTYALLMWLLCLLPIGLSAQSLSRYEYWFDDGFKSRKSVALSGAVDHINIDVPTSQLSYGPHRLYMRVRQSGGEYEYSPITSAVFVKLDRGNGDQLEYWFDDNIDNASIIDLPALDEDCDLVLNLDDTDLFPMGFHKLNMRVSTKGGGISGIYTSSVLKISSGIADQLEYWFDDDIANKKRLTGRQSNDGEMKYQFATDLDLSHLSPGLHRLCYRAVSENGITNSSVSSVSVIKMPGGNATKLEYWFDNDLTNKYRVSGESFESGQVYLFDINAALTKVAPGTHRMYYRAFSNDGQAVSAISSDIVTVKSRYNVDGTNATLKSYSVTVDDEDPVELTMSHVNDMTVPYTLNAADLTEGNHVVKMTVTNSLNLSSTVRGTFKATKPTLPAITLTAAETNGMVKLDYNSIPNDLMIRLVRKDANGKLHLVYSDPDGCYPAKLSQADSPTNGAYTYYVESDYETADGTRERLKSNEVTINVTNSKVKEVGNIVGSIYLDNKHMKGVKSTVEFGDGVTVVSNSQGVFYRSNVPLGTTFTVRLSSSEDYKSDTQEVTVSHKGITKVTLHVERNYDYVEDAVIYDLMFVEGVKYEPGQYLKVKVKPCHSKTSWRGRLRLRVIPQKYDYVRPDGEYNAIELLAKNTYDMTHNFYTVTSDEFYVDSYGEGKWITFSLEGLSASDEPEKYDFHVLSLGKSGSARWVMTNLTYNSTRDNPLVYEVAKSDKSNSLTNEDVNFTVNYITWLCGQIKGLNGYLGGVCDFVEKTAEAYYISKDMFELMIDAVSSSSSLGDLKKNQRFTKMSDAVTKAVSNTYNTELGLIKAYQDEMANQIREYNSESAALGYLKNAVSCINELEEYRTIGYNEEYLYCARKIIDKANLPFGPILNTYLDVGAAAINSIMTLGWAADEFNLARLFYEKKIKIQINITNSEGHSEHGGNLLEKVVVKGWNINKDNIVTANFTDWTSGGGILGFNSYPIFKQKDYDGGNPDRGTGGNIIDLDKPFQELWAEVYWTNGRVSYVPLTRKNPAVSYSKSSEKFIIEFQSGVSEYERLADVISLKE